MFAYCNTSTLSSLAVFDRSKSNALACDSIIWQLPKSIRDQYVSGECLMTYFSKLKEDTGARTKGHNFHEIFSLIKVSVIRKNTRQCRFTVFLRSISKSRVEQFFVGKSQKFVRLRTMDFHSAFQCKIRPKHSELHPITADTEPGNNFGLDE